ncbi:LOW QUALITY PROTEIN: hypothetical protein CVT26_004808 [Gymnopilus dilepis]|uniref:Uncharacterized protein n=1 Tax=Gymnopilus dilepis TaxID=231916 RepID=A0A409XZN4_9AGAR|nr:LOW QUALITY PROTEIN: hypothetical protein CVT26_004808 [Gymnopilus dilepis]
MFITRNPAAFYFAFEYSTGPQSPNEVPERRRPITLYDMGLSPSNGLPFDALDYRQLSEAKPRKEAIELWSESQRYAIALETSSRAGVQDVGQADLATVRHRVTQEMFEALPQRIRNEWSEVANESECSKHAWTPLEMPNGRKKPLPKVFGGQLRTIKNVICAAQPVLDMISDATGWDANLLLGGPDPTDKGRLTILRLPRLQSILALTSRSVESSTSPARTHSDRSLSRHEAVEKFLIPTFGGFLKDCFPPGDYAFGTPSNESQCGKPTSTSVAINVGQSRVLDERTMSDSRISASMPLAKQENSEESSQAVTFDSKPTSHARLCSNGPSTNVVCLHSGPHSSKLELQCSLSPKAGSTIDSPLDVSPSSASLAESNPSITRTLPDKPNTSSCPSTIPLRTASTSASSNSHALSASQVIGPSTAQIPLSNKRPSDSEPTSFGLDLPITKRPRIESNSKAAAHATIAPSTDMSKIIPPSDAPEWFQNVLKLFQDNDLGSPEWLSLVRDWVELEKKENFKQKGDLRTSYQRPTCVRDWIKRKRSCYWRPYFSARGVIKEMEDKFMTWWTMLQPDWRLCGPISKRSKCSILKSATPGSWETLRVTGLYGLCTVLVALYAWCWALKSERKSKDSLEYKHWLEALNDVQFTLVEMLKSA